MKPMPELNDELGSLLLHISSVAIAIRLLGQFHWENPETRPDIVWLADSLHKLSHLGEALKSHNSDAISESCDWLIRDWKDFRDDIEINKSFVRYCVIDLEEAICILDAIKNKALASLLCP